MVGSPPPQLASVHTLGLHQWFRYLEEGGVSYSVFFIGFLTVNHVSSALQKTISSLALPLSFSQSYLQASHPTYWNTGWGIFFCGCNNCNLSVESWGEGGQGRRGKTSVYVWLLIVRRVAEATLRTRRAARSDWSTQKIIHKSCVTRFKLNDVYVLQHCVKTDSNA